MLLNRNKDPETKIDLFILGIIVTIFILIASQCGCNGSPEPDPKTLYINFHTAYNLQPGEDASESFSRAIDSLSNNDNYTDGYFIIDKPGIYIINEGTYDSDKPYTLLIGGEY